MDELFNYSKNSLSKYAWKECNLLIFSISPPENSVQKNQSLLSFDSSHIATARCVGFVITMNDFEIAWINSFVESGILSPQFNSFSLIIIKQKLYH